MIDSTSMYKADNLVLVQSENAHPQINERLNSLIETEMRKQDLYSGETDLTCKSTLPYIAL